MKKMALLFIVLTVFIDCVSFGMIFPILPYYIEHFKSSSFIVGLIISSFYLMQFLFSPIWGRVSDKIGRKPVILIGIVGTSFALLLSGATLNIIWLLISRVIAGFFSAATNTATYAYIADITKEKERASKFGLLGAAWGLGFVIGPILGSILSVNSISLVFIIAGVIELINFTFTFLFLPQFSKSVTQRKQNNINSPNILSNLKNSLSILMLIYFISSFANASLEVVFPLFTQFKFDINETSIGFLFTFIGITVAITQGLIVGKAVALFGEIKTIIIATIFMIIGYSLIAFSGNLPVLILSVGILAFGLALNDPSLTALISKQSKEGMGTILGITWSSGSLAKIIGPVFGGIIYAKIFPASPFFFNSLFLLFSLFILIYIFLRKNSAKF